MCARVCVGMCCCALDVCCGAQGKSRGGGVDATRVAHLLSHRCSFALGVAGSESTALGDVCVSASGCPACAEPFFACRDAAAAAISSSTILVEHAGSAAGGLYYACDTSKLDAVFCASVAMSKCGDVASALAMFAALSSQATTAYDVKPFTRTYLQLRACSAALKLLCESGAYVCTASCAWVASRCLLVRCAARVLVAGGSVSSADGLRSPREPPLAVQCRGHWVVAVVEGMSGVSVIDAGGGAYAVGTRRARAPLSHAVSGTDGLACAIALSTLARLKWLEESVRPPALSPRACYRCGSVWSAAVWA